MWNKRAGIICVAFLLVTSAVSAQELPQSTITQAYAAVTPAICVVKYTAELTNPQTNTSDRRDIRVLGLIVSPSGLVMAHGHMQGENSVPISVRVTVGQGEAEKEYDAKLLKKPDDINICFLQLESDTPLNLPHVKFARGVPLALGEPVGIFGLMNENFDFARSVNVRMVGAILEKPRVTYCLDQAVAFGYVGGPAINASGQVVGVIGFDLSPEEGGELYTRSGAPLLYQASLFAKYIDTPPTATDAGKGLGEAWLGIFHQPLTDDLAEYWGLPKEGGVVVSTVVPGSPSEAAGFKDGDVVILFNGTPVRAKQNREVLAFTKLVRDTPIGTAVPVRVLRDGQPLELQVTLAEKPKAARDAGEFEDKTFGLTVRELTTDVRLVLNLSEDVKGVIVRRVKSGSFADLAQIRPGVIILNFGGSPVTNLDEFKEAVAKAAETKPGEIAVFSRIGPRTGFFRLQPRWDVAPKAEGDAKTP